jgi:hypothetical protein
VRAFGRPSRADNPIAPSTGGTGPLLFTRASGSFGYTFFASGAADAGARILRGFGNPEPITAEGLTDLDKLLEGVGFREEGIGPKYIGPVDVLRSARTREHDYPQTLKGRLVSNPFQNPEAIHARHLEVEHDKRGERKFGAVRIATEAAQVFDGLLPGSYYVERVGNIGLSEDVPKQKRVILGILDEQKERFIGHSNENNPAKSAVRGVVAIG